MKRMVDFVSERVASATIKMIRKVQIQRSIEDTTKQFQEYILKNQTNDLDRYEIFIVSFFIL